MSTLKNKPNFLVSLATTLATNNRGVMYIAGKVTGLPVREYQAKFKAAQDKLEADGFKVLNPCEYIAPDETWELAMRKAATLLCMADSVYMLPDWNDSTGATMEFELAVKFGLSVVFE